ncbi:hypothetical protein G7046_g719 [Stylonectria norvegica]|nr:hypothetical protein G7046_g719 [Stylonectria norvegica]
MVAEPDPKAGLPKDLKNDNRDVADLWKEALKSYKGIVGFDLERKFENVDAMIIQGTKEMNSFHKFRHNEKKVDKLRSLFATNLDYIEKGAQQLISAAVPAFPPAAAIGTAITYLLSACRQVSADYDIVVAFFEDMNSFLQRIVILETRVPKYKAYQNCLMDVFTSFLNMCGFAHKYIELGRFKKWITNLWQGEDTELGGARKGMDQKLAYLQNATEFAILGNTEELQKMTLELQRNQQSHQAMLEEQKEVMGAIRDTTENIRSDMTKLLKAFDEQKKDRSREQKGKPSSTEQNKPPSAKRIRNMLPEVEGEDHEYHILKETMVKDTCSWVSSEPLWEEWLSQEGDSRALLAITGQPGTGKSHIGATIFDKLFKIAAEDTTKRTCATHFYFREQHKSLSGFIYAVITIVNQVVEQSSPLCELINTEYLKDEVAIDVWVWRDLVQHLLGSAFKKGSTSRLFVVFDGIDELDTLSDFTDFLKIIEEEGLRISVVFTSRPEVLPPVSEIAPVLELQVTKDKQLQDLKALVWNRMNTLAALRRFGRYIKQRIADKVEAAAPNMLYAEHMLVRFNSLGREGAVLQNLDKPLPPDIHGIYDTLFEECNRRTASNHQDLVTKLLQWIAFSFRPLVLDEVSSLLRYFTKDDNFSPEEIPEPFAKFLRVGDPGADAEARARLQSQGGWGTAVQDLEKSQGVSSPDQVYNDGSLPVKFQERSMRSYFRDAPKPDTTLRFRASDAHRQIFLAAAGIARPVPLGDTSKLDSRLRAYATHYLIHHWRQIKAEECSPSQIAEVMEALGAVLSNQHDYVTMLEWQGAAYSDKFTSETFDKVSQWAKLLNSRDGKARPQLSEKIEEWWTGFDESPRKCLLQLARGHVQKLYRAADLKSALVSYGAARKAFEASQLDSILFEQAAKNFEFALGEVSTDQPLSDKQAALGIPGVFDDISMNATAYRAVASIFLKFKHRAPAEEMCKKAIETCDPSLHVESVKIFVLMAKIQLKRGRTTEACESITKCMEHVGQDGIPPALKREALITKARIEVKREDNDAAAISYAEARSADPATLTPGDVLEEEVDMFVDYDDKAFYINTLKSWTSLERLTWMAWKYEDLSGDRHAILRDIAAESGEKAFVIDAYKEAIGYLDNVNAGAPLRCDLAQVYLQVSEDLDKARQVLDEVLDSSSTGWPYAVTEELPDFILERAIDLQTDVLFRLFKKSRDPMVKKELLDAAKGVLTRPLALDVPPQSDTYLLQRRIIMARMYLKLGPASEFQATLGGVIDACIEALQDKVGWNDATNLVFLSAALTILSDAVPNGKKLKRVAHILSSARFSRLSPGVKQDDDDEESEESGSDDGSYSSSSSSSSSSEGEGDEDEDNGSWEDEGEDGVDGVDGDDGDASGSGEEDSDDPPTNEGDLARAWDVEQYCDGQCNPATEFCWWGGKVAYDCITCFTGFLCESCYEKRQADNRGEEPLKVRQYCGRDHEYIKGPIEGWQGVKDGKVMLEGEDPVEFEELLRQIKEELCKAAWESFWEG